MDKNGQMSIVGLVIGCSGSDGGGVKAVASIPK